VGKSTVTILRGLPGSGKSTYAEFVKSSRAALGTRVTIVSADNYMVDSDGNYHFDPHRLVECHSRCQADFVSSLLEGTPVVVDNTNTRRDEFLFYQLMARQMVLEVHVIDLYDAGLSNEVLAKRNTHEVPVGKISDMRGRYEK